MRNKYLLIFIVLFFWANAENNASDFVMTGLSARAMGLGNSMTGMSGHCDTVFFNPAGLADNGMQNEFSFAGVNNFDMAERKNIGCKLKTDSVDYAINISNSLVQDIPKTFWGSDDRPIQDGSFISEQYNYTLTISKKQDEFLRYGINIKKYSYKIDHYTAQALGFDAGILYRLPNNIFDTNILLGAAIHNIGRTKVSWSTSHTDTMPMRFNVGASLYQSLFSRKLVFSTELEQMEESRLIVRNGVEYWLVNSLCALRAGVDDGRLGYGVGLEYNDIILDYAQADYADLGLIRRVSLMLRF